ncbi:hypothetical protein GCM10016234_35020 [Tianweitania populi]|uniref:Integrase n=1 Tax=Tianweitania populi TaxID=1607949 RepID=A0A8J3DX54_9HYPH|nr:hypothetical protein GCM10016234_35020 [Tianweitania populi]
MTALVVHADRVPTLLEALKTAARMRFHKFLTANIRNVNTRRAYGRAVSEFLTWCEAHGVRSITTVQPLSRRQLY